jgi:hypothetical protein
MSCNTLANFGCSFAYGNQASGFNTLCGYHRSPASWVAEFFNLTEVNYARPGNSNDGIVDSVLNWLSSSDRDHISKTVVLIGWTSGIRYGYVSNSNFLSNRRRYKYALHDSIAEKAFSLGPPNPYSFKTIRWGDRNKDLLINFEETARLSLYRNLLTINALSQQYKFKAYHYHALDPFHYSEITGKKKQDATNCSLRKLINTQFFYKFEEYSIQELANSNPQKFHISSADTHPNHLCYKTWAEEFCNWSITADSS